MVRTDPPPGACCPQVHGHYGSSAACCRCCCLLSAVCQPLVSDIGELQFTPFQFFPYNFPTSNLYANTTTNPHLTSFTLALFSLIHTQPPISINSTFATMGSDPQYAKWPLLPLSQNVFTLTNPYASRPTQEAAVKKLQDAIEEHKMAPLYKYLAHPLEGILNVVGEGGVSAPGKPLSRKSSAVGMIASKGTTATVTIPWDEGLYQKLKEENDRELEEYQKEEDEAVEKAGDTEISAAKGKRAEFWARVGDKACVSLVSGASRQARMVMLIDVSTHRRKPSPPTKICSKRPASWAPRSTSSSP